MLPFLDRASVRTLLFIFSFVFFLAHFARFVCPPLFLPPPPLPKVWCVGTMPWRRSRVHRARNASMAEFPSQVPHAIFLAARSYVALAIAQIQQGATALSSLHCPASALDSLLSPLCHALHPKHRCQLHIVRNGEVRFHGLDLYDVYGLRSGPFRIDAWSIILQQMRAGARNVSQLPSDELHEMQQWKILE